MALLPRNSRVLVIAAAGLILSPIVAIVVWLSGPPVNPDNFTRIQTGMTVDEIEAILGPGDDLRWTLEKLWQDRIGTPKEYSGEGYSIVVWYDETNQVCSKADFEWFYRWAWEVPLRYKIRTQFGHYPRAHSSD